MRTTTEEARIARDKARDRIVDALQLRHSGTIGLGDGGLLQLWDMPAKAAGSQYDHRVAFLIYADGSFDTLISGGTGVTETIAALPKMAIAADSACRSAAVPSSPAACREVGGQRRTR